MGSPATDIPTAEDVTEDPFLIAHTLDPTIEIDRNYATWQHSGWMSWLNRRAPLYQQVYDRRGWKPKSTMKTKGINTVVVATPEEITNIFTGNLIPYKAELVWSNEVLPTYLFQRTNQGVYRIYECPPTFIAVRLHNGRPIHLDAFNTERVTRGNSNFQYAARARELH